MGCFSLPFHPDNAAMVVSESPARDLFRLIVWYPLRWLVLAMPLTWGLALFRLMGDLHAALSRGGGARLLENMARFQPPLALSPRAQRQAVRAYYRNHYVDRLCIFLFPRLDQAAVKRLITFEGLEHLDAARARGRGAILVHGHFGPVHIPLVALGRLGYPMNQVGLPSDEGLSWVGKHVAFRLRLRYEAMIPAEIIKADGYLRPVFRWLKGNGVIMITGDGSGTTQQVGEHRVLPYLGQPFPAPLGPALLAAKTGAVLMPMFILPGEKTPYHIVIEPPLPVSGEADAATVSRQFLARLEARVREHPGSMHFLDRFHPDALLAGEAPRP